MATSSINHNFVLKDPKKIKRLVAAIEKSQKQPKPTPSNTGRLLTDPDEIVAFMAKRKHNENPSSRHNSNAIQQDEMMVSNWEQYKRYVRCVDPDCTADIDEAEDTANIITVLIKLHCIEGGDEYERS